MRQYYYLFLTIFNSLFKARNLNKLRVLAYHTIASPKNFEKQICYLKKHYNFISINQLSNHLYSNDVLPKKALLLTFDDGDISVLNNGLSVLKKHGVPSCLFIITSLIGTENDYWIKQVENFEMKIKGSSYAVARRSVNSLKNMTNLARLATIKDYPMVSKKQLSSLNLLKMEKLGMYIGNHTHTHPMLDNCSDEEIIKELEESTRIFKILNLEGANIFAYPNGNADYRTNKILKNFGMKIIFLFDHKLNKKQLDPFNISRIRIDAETPYNEFKVKVSGLHSKLMELKNRIS